MWYLSLALLKGATRVAMLIGFVILSYFQPAMCMFPDGYEGWDSAHVCFMCYVAERVENDKIRERHLEHVVQLGGVLSQSRGFLNRIPSRQGKGKRVWQRGQGLSPVPTKS